MNALIKVLVGLGSAACLGFGVWHFFVPAAWKWNDYILPSATELVAAVRAINVFFSLSLVLFGVMNLLFIFGGRANRFSILVLLAATSVLWLARVGMQIAYPQGSLYPALQYGLLAAFIIILVCFGMAFMIVLGRDAAAFPAP